MNTTVPFKKKAKDLIYPFTLLTLLVLLCLLLSIQALIIAFTQDHTAAIYAAIVLPITLLVLVLYIIERFLTKRIAYTKLMIAELMLGLFVFLAYSYQDRTTSIRFTTDQEYLVILFDSKQDSLAEFSRKGVFGKELLIHNRNILHLDSSLYLRTDLQINRPEEWETYFTDEGRLQINGKSIAYIFSSKNSLNKLYIQNSQTYLDSLINRESRK